jgi:hypothetical protein
LLIGLCALTTAVAGCGSGGGSGSKGGGGGGGSFDGPTTGGNLKIAKLGAAEEASSARRMLSTPGYLTASTALDNFERAPLSNTPFGMAVVDGYKVNVTHLTMEPAGESGNHFEAPISEIVDLAKPDGIAFEKEIDFAVGTFGSVGIKTSSNISVKAFCRINNNKLLYTTADGTEVMEVIGGHWRSLEVIGGHWRTLEDTGHLL